MKWDGMAEDEDSQSQGPKFSDENACAEGSTIRHGSSIVGIGGWNNSVLRVDHANVFQGVVRILSPPASSRYVSQQKDTRGAKKKKDDQENPYTVACWTVPGTTQSARHFSYALVLTIVVTALPSINVFGHSYPKYRSILCTMTYCHLAKHQVQVGGGIEGDGNKDGKFCQFLKQHGALNPTLAPSRSLLSFRGQLPKHKTFALQRCPLNMSKRRHWALYTHCYQSLQDVVVTAVTKVEVNYKAGLRRHFVIPFSSAAVAVGGGKVLGYGLMRSGRH
ncbi:hypothetical protein ARMSODRAFT_973578 [Armillaria solidipes]|uniref:Uncharacterized protein n=1 Tax=Armillaria solidipes TaxID=1076256 RepID=A0A2H3BQ87_9AGAR|nr:hypothetical protein ARMSODRAFT_973578 [Armillaria solidipes]